MLQELCKAESKKPKSMLEYTRAMLAPRSTYHNTFLELVLCGLLIPMGAALLSKQFAASHNKIPFNSTLGVAAAATTMAKGLS